MLECLHTVKTVEDIQKQPCNARNSRCLHSAEGCAYHKIATKCRAMHEQPPGEMPLTL